jgi:hypothetical protein
MDKDPILRALRQKAARNPNDPELICDIGRRLKKHNKEESLKLLRELTRKHPTYARGFYEAAHATTELWTKDGRRSANLLSEALSTYNDATKLDPKYCDLFGRPGWLDYAIVLRVAGHAGGIARDSERWRLYRHAVRRTLELAPTHQGVLELFADHPQCECCHKMRQEDANTINEFGETYAVQFRTVASPHVLRKCKRCEVASFCDNKQACWKTAWEDHKFVCSRLKAVRRFGYMRRMLVWSFSLVLTQMFCWKLSWDSVSYWCLMIVSLIVLHQYRGFLNRCAAALPMRSMILEKD